MNANGGNGRRVLRSTLYIRLISALGYNIRQINKTINALDKQKFLLESGVILEDIIEAKVGLYAKRESLKATLEEARVIRDRALAGERYWRNKKRDIPNKIPEGYMHPL